MQHNPNLMKFTVKKMALMPIPFLSQLRIISEVDFMYDFTIDGTLNARLHDVYNAFHDPNVLVRWFAPGNMMVSQFMSNFIEGGNYRLILQSPDGFQQTIVGCYQTINLDQSLCFTWRWEDTNDTTKVDIEFTCDNDTTTSIKLTQSGFNREEDMLHQQYGWIASLEKLSLVTRPQAMVA
ncbi:SRPBCC family protein [Brumicola nitratireducens]|uniref:Activator of Hsp90 ATPase homologue 1/2-like C-terminal domain-containing protein n=1 Tax=Glaciecola nitratireducens (strain JCM 12485 / KCTC 12276 / FR1064) TaxID=1085623 RepID=G4QJW2_GLANF|nr:SRPBCC domain-containing protein [Glaciecola nitratireducens]AEP29003.1 hypothetical protein GNIT_0865 [Glaciecola nitratireducens FR1064]